MKRSRAGFEDFDELLDALTPRRRSTSAERKASRLYQRERAKRKRAAKEKAARIDRDARRAGTEEGRARVAAAMAKIATGEPGRWLRMLRAMEPGKIYSAAEAAALIGLDIFTSGLTLDRDLVRRGLVERRRGAIVRKWIIAADRVATRHIAGHSVTDLGLRVAAEGVAALPPAKRKGRRKAPLRSAED